MSVMMGDNSAPAAVPAPAPVPAPPAAPTPDQPAAPAPGAAPGGVRNMDTLQALLSGADPASLGFGNPVPAAPAPEAPPQGQGTQPAATPPVPAPGPQIPDKFRNQDGTVNTEALMKSYLETEGIIGRQSSEVGQLRRQLQQLQTPAPAPGTPPAAPPGTPPDAPKPPSLLDRLRNPQEKEAITEQIYEDPTAFYTQLAQEMEDRAAALVDQRMKPLSPIVEQHQQNQQVDAFAQQVAEFTASGQYADFQDLAPAIKEIIQEYGDAVFRWPDPVKTLYFMAKGQQAQAQPATPPAPTQTFEEMFADPANQKLAAEKLQAKIISDYVQSIAGGAPPTVIGGQPGGTAPAAPGVKPRNAREASAMFARHLGG